MNLCPELARKVSTLLDIIHRESDREKASAFLNQFIGELVSCANSVGSVWRCSNCPQNGRSPDTACVAPILPVLVGGKLTPREREVLHHVSNGQTDRTVSTALGISPWTVAKHMENILRKLRVETRAAAVAENFRHQNAPSPAETG
jgi:DNA-binding CsgD family transcriptional regulator